MFFLTTLCSNGLNNRYKDELKHGADKTLEMGKFINRKWEQDKTDETWEYLSSTYFEMEDYLNSLVDFYNFVIKNTIHQLVAGSGDQLLLLKLICKELISSNEETFASIIDRNGYSNVTLSDVTKRLNNMDKSKASEHNVNKPQKHDSNGKRLNRNGTPKDPRNKTDKDDCKWGDGCGKRNCFFWHPTPPGQRRRKMRFKQSNKQNRMRQDMMYGQSGAYQQNAMYPGQVPQFGLYPQQQQQQQQQNSHQMIPPQQAQRRGP
eukprot:48312_1